MYLIQKGQNDTYEDSRTISIAFTTTEIHQEGQQKFTYNYLVFPAMAQYQIPIQSDIKFNIIGGFHLGFLMGGTWYSRSRTERNGDVNTEERTEGLFDSDAPLDDDVYNKAALGFNVGGGITYSLPTGRIFANLKYQIDFTNLYNEDELEDYFGTNAVDHRSKHNLLGLSVGYLYPLDL
jgi:uncharacterized membrane protein YciS (DUF1049 family)